MVWEQDEPGAPGILEHDRPVAQCRHTWTLEEPRGGLRAGHYTDHEHIHAPALSEYHPNNTNPTHRWRSKSDLCTFFLWACLPFAATIWFTDCPEGNSP